MSNPATPNLHKAGKPNLHGVGTANSPPAKGEYPEGGRGFLPKLRFSEFRDSVQWEMMKFGEIASKGKETFDPQKSNDTPRLIELENIESRTGRILGFTEIKNQSSLKQRFQAGDVLFGKLRPYLQKFARPCFTGICTTEIWVLRSEIVLNSFLFYLVQTKRFTQLANISSGSRMPRAEWSFLADSDFGVPHPDEQQKIADCLNSLDDLIAAENQKLEALRRHKQGLMQQLFPQAGETVPRLRFPRFQTTQNWSQTSLGKVVTPIVREREKPKVPYTGLGIRSHGRGTFRKENEQPEKNIMDRLYEVSCNDLIVNITFAWEGAIAIVQPEDNGALVSHRFPTYQFDKDFLLPDFFQYPILNKQFIYKLGVISPGGAGRNRILNKLDFLKIDLYLPEIAEQQKIADCLSSLDDLIVATGRKLETLRQHKQGLMQQLFPSVEHH